MSEITTTAIQLSGGRTPTWDVTVTRDDGETRTYRVMNESEEAAKIEALAMWDYDHGPDGGQMVRYPEDVYSSSYDGDGVALCTAPHRGHPDGFGEPAIKALEP